MALPLFLRTSGPSTAMSLATCPSLPLNAPSRSANGAAALSVKSKSRLLQSVFGGRRRSSRNGQRRAVCVASTIPDLHSLNLLADWMNWHHHVAVSDLHSSSNVLASWMNDHQHHVAVPDLHSASLMAMPDIGQYLPDWIKPNPHWFESQLDESKFSVGLTMEEGRVLDDQYSDAELSIDFLRHFYMAAALVFAWGCCVFGSMNDEFYDGDEYRDAGGNGTGHWVYDAAERDEDEARQEMWSEDLATQIEQLEQVEEEDLVKF